MLEYLLSNWTLLTGGVLLGTTVGVLTGIFGAGGGFIITPALNIFLGVEMSLAVGTSACQVLGASSFSLANHIDRRMLGVKVALFIGLGIPLGTYPGALLVARLKQLAPLQWHGHTLDPVNLILLGVFSVFLLVIAAWMFYDSMWVKQLETAGGPGFLRKSRIPPLFRFRTIPAGEFSIPVLILLGISMGFMSGLLGIGGGVIMLPVLYYLVGQEIKAAAKTSMMLILVSGLFSTLFHAFGGNINYPLAAALVAGAFLGARGGAYLQRRLDSRSLRKYFSFVVLGAWLLVVGKLIKMFIDLA